MDKPLKICFVLIMIITLSSLNFAHHAMEYIRIESFTTTYKGQFIFHLHYDYMVEDKNNPFLDHYEFTPGISFGISNRLMVDVHTHFAKFGRDHLLPSFQNNFSTLGPSPFLEAAAFSIQYRFSEKWPINVAIAGVYEIPFQRSRDLLGGKEVFEGILILSKTFNNHFNVCANLKYGKDGNETVKEWGLGIKLPFTAQPHSISAGVEILGDFSTGDISIMPGLYMPIGNENIIFKSGLEIGLNTNIIKMNVSLMYLF